MPYTGTPRKRSLPETAQRMQAFYSPAFFGPMTVPGAQAPREMGGFSYMGAYTSPTTQPTTGRPGYVQETLDQYAPKPAGVQAFDHPPNVQSWLEALTRGRRVNEAFKVEPYGMANLGRYGVGQLSNYGKGALAAYRPLADRRYV